jgi:hypothetical protein
VRHLDRKQRIARRLEKTPALLGHAQAARRSLQQANELPLSRCTLRLTATS